MSGVSLERARAAKERVFEVFRSAADVVGVGITRFGAEYGVKVNLRELPDPGSSLPDSVDGVPVRIEVVGSIEKRKESS
jgi:hypothetical protein